MTATPPEQPPELAAEATVAAAASEMADAEETLTAAALRAIADYLRLARDAVLRAGGLPDLAAFPPDTTWLQLVRDYLEAAEREVYIRAYQRMMPGEAIIDYGPYVQRFIATVSDRLKIWPAGAFEEIRLELADGIARGETIDQLRDRIGTSLDIDAPSREIRERLAALEQRITEAEDPSVRRELRTQRAATYRDLRETDRAWHWKARRIARTETTMAVNGGLHDATEARIAATGEEGVRKQWLATSDDRVRASHARANGQVQFWGDPFIVGGHRMQHPGYPGAPAAEVCNCRCTLLVLPPGTDPYPLEPIGEDAPGNLAAATTEAAMSTPAVLLAHNRPGDHPMVKGNWLRGLDGFQHIADHQRDAWRESPMPAGFLEALKGYTAWDYMSINRELRGGPHDTGVGNIRDKTRALDDGFADARAVLPENVLVWRRAANAQQIFGGLKPGDEFIDRGYTSTTFDDQVAEDFVDDYGDPADTVMVQIRVPAGSRAIAPDAIDAGTQEDELTLPRGTKFHVVRMPPSFGGPGVVQLEVVSTPDNKSLGASAHITAAAPEPPEPAEPPPAGSNNPTERFVWRAGDIDLVHDTPPDDPEEPVSSNSVTAATETETALPDGWRGPLVPLGIPSCDDRVIGVPDGEPQTRPLPRPFKGQYASAEGHDGATVVGLIDRAWIDADPAGSGVPMLWGEGPLDLGDPVSAEWARRLGEGYAGWVSVDLDVPTVTEMVWDENTGQLLEPEFAAPPGDGEGSLEDLISGLFDGPPALPDGQRPVQYVNPWRLMSATLVADQAFPEVQVRPVYGYVRATTEPAALAAAAAPEDLMSQPVITTGPYANTTTTNGPLRPGRSLVAAPPPPPRNAPPAKQEDTAPPLPAVGDRVIVENADAGGPGEVTAVDTSQSPPIITVNLDAGGPVDVPADQVKPEPAGEAGQQPPAKKGPPARMTARRPATAALTAAAPLRPPAAWFADPKLEAPTPLTITAGGRVAGHLAVWDTCHTGYEGMCVTPPRSATSYALFHNGEVETDDGTLIACGKITLGGGHADPAAGLRAAVEHYDNTCTAAAIVRVYEDDHGIAVAGSVCPDADDTVVAALRRSPLSGDWRRYGGNLELVAALAVNVPGFPVRRPSLAAAANEQGRQNSLVAAGVLAPAPTALAAGIADAVSAALDARDRRTARAAAARARITAPTPPPYARTRAILAAARFAGGTASPAAARTAAAAGYAAAGGR